MTDHEPRYPIYIISKGRHDCCFTADTLVADGVDFHIVVEPQEFDLYAERYGKERILVLPFSNLGLGSIPARNWVWEHSREAGFKRHWILDDNSRGIFRRYNAQRIRCNSKVAFRSLEDFSDRYTNIAITGMNYNMFVPDKSKIKAFFLNCHVYSCLLILNELPYRWRGRYNEDTDLCLQVLSGGWCTILSNVYLIKKQRTMTMKGGNSTELYKNDGRLVMARSLERMWPYVAYVDRRFKRPQHRIKHEWKKFKHQLIRRTDIDWLAIENSGSQEYGVELKVADDIRSEQLKAIVKQWEDNS